jgi:hypothetical protein
MPINIYSAEIVEAILVESTSWLVVVWFLEVDFYQLRSIIGSISPLLNISTLPYPDSTVF